MSKKLKKNNNTINLLILFVNLIALFYLLLLAFFASAVTGDDYALLNQYNNLGIFKTITNTYLNFSGRYAAFFFSGILYKFFIITNSFLCITLIIILFGIFSFYIFLKKLLKGISQLTIVNYSAFMFCIFVLAAFDFSSFYWLCAISYFFVVFIFLVEIALLIDKQNSILQYIGILICSIYLGGGGEQFTPLILTLHLFFYLFLKLYSKNQGMSALRKKIIFSFIICSISFLFLLIAPGNYIRMNVNSNQPSLAMTIPLTFKAMALLSVHTIFKIPYYFVIIPLFIHLGSKNSLKINLHKIDTKVVFFILLFLIFAGIYPAVFVFGRLFDTRALTHIELLFIFFTAFLAYYLGNSSPHINKHIKFINYSILVAFIFFIISKTYIEYPLIRSYHKSIEERVNFLKNENKSTKGGIVNLKPLNHPTYFTYFSQLRWRIYRLGTTKSNYKKYISPYVTEDISVDPKLNIEVKKYYNLNFDVELVDQSITPTFNTFRNPNVD